MHLIWENLMKNLTLLWTGEFKGLDVGGEDYELGKAVWEAIALKTSAASDTIPSAYGSRVPNIAKDRPNVSAEMWSFWTLYLGPVLLRRRFKNVKYYRHFIELVRLLNLCIQFEITDEEIEDVRIGFINWVKVYEDVYFQNDVERMSVCPLTIHALLHIAPGIIFCGPVWCYWAFLMERYCDKSCILLPPKSPTPPSPNQISSIAVGLATRCDVKMRAANAAMKKAVVHEWGKVQRIDSDEGDTMRPCSLGVVADDARDATYVRYEMLVDQNARHRSRPDKFELQTFYGQLPVTHIYRVHFPAAVEEIGTEGPTTFIFVAIRNRVLKPDDRELNGLDIHFILRTGGLDVIDITSVQALVGRVKDVSDDWAIIDRSGALARA
ncbi:hypothetical protein C8J57DRAFT_1449122 [Mycena rebaudengoi]|nr:hypothetical protein C8J57DRAFT_1449122 [Mycena rebaudengoi]